MLYMCLQYSHKVHDWNSITNYKNALKPFSDILQTRECFTVIVNVLVLSKSKDDTTNENRTNGTFICNAMSNWLGWEWNPL